MAPTINYLLGIDVSKDCDGAIMYQVPTEANWHLRELKKLTNQT